MLVGACAYALPEKPETIALLPAFAGVIVAVESIVALQTGRVIQKFIAINAAAAAMLLLFVFSRIRPDLRTAPRESTGLMADLAILGLAIIFLAMAFRQFIEKAEPSSATPQS
jgi:hypothetical protein